MPFTSGIAQQTKGPTGLGATKMTMDIPRLSWEAIRRDLNDLTLKFMMIIRNLHVSQ
jgi:hypothetical protein